MCIKRLPVLFLALAAVLASCAKKDRTCSCTDSPGGADVFTVTNATKKQAEAKCISYTETNNGKTFTRTCTLSK